MTGLAKKLGIKPGDQVCLLDAPPEDVQALHEAAPPGVVFTNSLGELHCDLILFWPGSLEGLVERFTGLQRRIRPHGAIWAVMPKKKFALRRGVAFTWEEMQAAGLQTDLVDNKVASITEEDYGTRFVIRKDRRGSYQ
jgi:hypothetical protein